MKLELFYPVKNPFIITQKFGENLSPIYKQWGMIGHPGMDIVGNPGQIIRAAHDGIVTFTGQDSNLGWGVVIRTNDMRDYGSGSSFFKTIYWHCKTGSIMVSAGQQVKVGDPIAKCGNTGVYPNNAPPTPDAGTHLHFGLKPIAQGENEWTWYNQEQNNGYFGSIDPAPFFNNFYAEDSQTVLSILAKVVELLKKLLGQLNAQLKPSS